MLKDQNWVNPVHWPLVPEKQEKKKEKHVEMSSFSPLRK